LQCYSKKTQANQIAPYLLELDLCTAEQYDWWFVYIFSKQSTQRQKNFKLSPKQETTLNTVIEILRLNKNKTKLMNFQTCVKIALFLQNKYKTERYQTRVNHAVIDEKLLNEHLSQFEYLSPFEKSQSIFIYLTHYWSYIANYVNGTRKIEDFNINSDTSLSSSISSSFSLNTTTSFKQFFDFTNEAHVVDNSFVFDFNDVPFSKYVYENALVFLAWKKYGEENLKAVNDIVSLIEFDEPLLLDNFEVCRLL
jgi:hypothetical protein